MQFDISLDLYKIFCTVVQTGNMSTAAKELYISQPAVSMAIRQLENKLGKPLLLRTSKGIKTTVEGGVLYEYLRQALCLIDTAERKYLAMVNLEIGEVKIGASDTILSKYLTPYIQAFVASNSGINIKVTNRTTFETVRLLREGKVDVGFVNLPIQEARDLEIHECIAIHDCIVGGEKYKELCKTGLNIAALQEYPLILLERDSNSRCYVDKYAMNNGVVLEPNMELGSSDLLIKFASIDFGLTFVIKEFVQDEIDSKTIYEIPLHPPIPPRQIGIIKLREVTLSYAADRFTSQFIKERKSKKSNKGATK